MKLVSDIIRQAMKDAVNRRHRASISEEMQNRAAASSFISRELEMRKYLTMPAAEISEHSLEFEKALCAMPCSTYIA